MPDEEHARLVARFALRIFDGWKRFHKLPEKRWRDLVETAALLHDTGITINYYNHTRHSGYIIENARLFGMSHMDIVFASIIAAWHHGVNRSYLRNKPYRKLITDKDIEDLTRAAVIVAIAESLDHPHMGDILDVEARDLDEAAQLTLIARKDPNKFNHLIFCKGF